MKRNLLLLTAIAIVLTSFIAQAGISPPPPTAESGPLRPAGTVSASGASNLDDLQAKLAEKAHQKGQSPGESTPPAARIKCPVPPLSINNPPA